MKSYANAVQKMRNLLKIADELDRAGLIKEADELDSIIKIMASQPVTLESLERMTNQDLTDTLKEMITFELKIEPYKDGGGNVLRAIPKLHDKWTDGLLLGDASQYNL